MTMVTANFMILIYDLITTTSFLLYFSQKVLSGLGKFWLTHFMCSTYICLCQITKETFLKVFGKCPRSEKLHYKHFAI